MRSVEEIKADIVGCESDISTSNHGGHVNRQKSRLALLNYELRAAITASIPLDRLEAICAAEREGRCVVLPCKVGDTVYANPIGITTAYKITFICFSQERLGRLFFSCIGNPDWEFYDDEIGETTFLTRAEAQAMKGGAEARGV